MKKIEIRTTQNVVIEYQLATFIERVVAFILDLVIMSVFSLIWMTFVGVLATEENAGIFAVPLIIMVYFYTFLFETFNNGQTPGKLILRIKVIKLSGEKANVFDYLLRWVFRLVDIYVSFGAVGGIGIATTDNGQRLGDYLANTTVIKLNREEIKALPVGQRRKDAMALEPKYPEVVQLNENQMLLVKEMIGRLRVDPSDSNREAALLLCKKICQILDIKPAKISSRDFLQQLLREYIILTR